MGFTLFGWLSWGPKGNHAFLELFFLKTDTPHFIPSPNPPYLPRRVGAQASCFCTAQRGGETKRGRDAGGGVEGGRRGRPRCSEVFLEILGVPSISIFSRDPNLFRKPSKKHRGNRSGA